MSVDEPIIDCGNLYQLAEAKDQIEIQQLVELTEKHLGIRFPTSYLENGSLFFLTNPTGEIVGSTFYTTRSPFRSIQSIPPNFDGTEYQSILNASDGSVAEVNGVWLDPNQKSPFVTFSFWSQLLEKLFHSGAKKFLFTYDHKNSQMKYLAKLMNPVEVYSGETVPLEGMKSSTKETIVYGTDDQVKMFLKLLDRRDNGQRSDFEKGFAKRILEVNKSKRD